jgi:GTP pyrophosphokinase
MARVTEKERLVSVDWGTVDQLYPVVVHIDAFNRVGLLRDISTLVAEEGVNIASVTSTDHDDDTSSVFLTLEIRSISQLSRLLSKLEGVSGVTSVMRGPGAS